MSAEYRCFSSPNTCPSCGAGAHNEYKHYPDCIANLKSVDLVPYWNQGWNARVQAGNDDFSIPKHLSDDKLVAWGMGMSCAAHMRQQGAPIPLRSNIYSWSKARAA